MKKRKDYFPSHDIYQNVSSWFFPLNLKIMSKFLLMIKIDNLFIVVLTSRNQREERK